MATEKELRDMHAFYENFSRRVHKALKPAIPIWQKETNHPLTWPDTVGHIEWLVKKLKEKTK